ncbi:hypothetical protein [Methylocella sp.]|uniref:hypothetical protein n=1 Tax=Methylocella sp. TaxID=1978226 RepID=UPI003783A51F
MALTTQGETLGLFPETITVSSRVMIRERKPARQIKEAQAEAQKPAAVGARETRLAPASLPARRGPAHF